MPYAPTYL
jgi:hypothetical protein